MRNLAGSLIVAERMACFLCRQIPHAARIWSVLFEPRRLGRWNAGSASPWQVVGCQGSIACPHPSGRSEPISRRPRSPGSQRR